MLPDPELSAAAYGSLRSRISDILRSTTQEERRLTIPACPAWNVTDLAAHLAGNARDLVTGNLDGVASDPWTAAQIERAAGSGVDELVDEWSEDGPTVEALLANGPAAPVAQLIFDTCTHEQDLISALGRTGGRDQPEQAIGISFMASTLDSLSRGLQLPAIALESPGQSWFAGEGDAEIRMEGTLFDLLRALGGRRTADEIDALCTHGSFEPYLLIYAEPSPLRLPARSLGE